VNLKRHLILPWRFVGRRPGLRPVWHSIKIINLSKSQV
jgi:hypothetical protein